MCLNFIWPGGAGSSTQSGMEEMNPETQKLFADLTRAIRDSTLDEHVKRTLHATVEAMTGAVGDSFFYVPYKRLVQFRDEDAAVKEVVEAYLHALGQLVDDGLPPGSLEYRLAHAVFQQPASRSIKVWRYISLAKFICLLSEQRLHFPRLNQFADPHEGSLTAKTVEWLKQYVIEHNLRIAYDVISESFRDSRRTTFVCCWHENSKSRRRCGVCTVVPAEASRFKRPTNTFFARSRIEPEIFRRVREVPRLSRRVVQGCQHVHTSDAQAYCVRA